MGISDLLGAEPNSLELVPDRSRNSNLVERDLRQNHKLQP